MDTKPRWISVLARAAVVSWLLVSPCRATVPAVYLVQNSGWMEPFYNDPASKFRPLLTDLIDATARTGDPVVIASFNQDGQLPNRRSPEVLLNGAYDPAAAAGALRSLDLPVRPNGRLTDADFNGALSAGVNDLLARRSGIIWLVTNNKNSPNNSQEVVRNTRAFAEALRSNLSLPFVVAYPLRLAVKGRLYSETGLIIYGIAYGDDAVPELRALIRGPSLTQLFSDPPVQLKALERAPLVFTPQTVAPATVTTMPLPGGGILVRDVPGGGVTLRITGTLRSDYYPQVIDQARATLHWAQFDPAPGTDAPSAAPSAAIEPDRLRRLAPLDVLQDVTLTLTLPALPRPNGFAGIFADSATFTGVMEIALDGLELSLQDEFQRKIGQVAALDQLPDVFFDYRRLSAATTELPIQIDVRYSLAPLVLTLALLLGVLAATAGTVWLLRRTREYSVPLNGRTQRFRLKPFQPQDVRLPDGRIVRVVGTVFGSPQTSTIDPQRRV
jgi:hypothetical protein